MHYAGQRIVVIELAAELSDLWAAAPDGITIRELRARLETDYNDTYAIARLAHSMGYAVFATKADCRTKVLMPPGSADPVWDLTPKQRAVLDWMVANMSDDGTLRASYGEIARALGANSISVDKIGGLDCKGYLEILDRGGPHQKTMFRIYPQGDGPKGWSAFHTNARRPPYIQHLLR